MLPFSKAHVFRALPVHTSFLYPLSVPCSFGFDIESCENWWDDNEVYHTRITGINPLYEVSPCTFPAYKATTINARNKEQIEDIKKRYEQAKHEKRELWKKEALKKLKGE